MDNFQCNKCFKTFTVPNYNIIFKNGVTLYNDKKNNLLKCPHCTSADIMFLEKEGEYSCTFTRFNSMSDSEKKRVLKKRSSDHFEKKLKEHKRYLDENFTGRSQDVDFLSNA